MDIKKFDEFVNEAKKNLFDKLDDYAVSKGEWGWTSLNHDELAEVIDMDKADKIADREFGEFGFATLSTKEKIKVLRENPELVQLDESVNEALKKDFTFKDKGGRDCIIKNSSNTVPHIWVGLVDDRMHLNEDNCFMVHRAIEEALDNDGYLPSYNDEYAFEDSYGTECVVRRSSAVSWGLWVGVADNPMHLSMDNALDVNYYLDKFQKDPF